MSDEVQDLLDCVAAGRLEEAFARLPHLRDVAAKDPGRAYLILPALQQACRLVRVQRAHMVKSLTALGATRLYEGPLPRERSTWHLEG